LGLTCPREKTFRIAKTIGQFSRFGQKQRPRLAYVLDSLLDQPAASLPLDFKILIPLPPTFTLAPGQLLFLFTVFPQSVIQLVKQLKDVV
jgi:hypothetical protein